MFCTIRKIFNQVTQLLHVVEIRAVKMSAHEQCERINPDLFFIFTKRNLQISAALGQHRFRNAIPVGLELRINCTLDHFFSNTTFLNHDSAIET